MSLKLNPGEIKALITLREHLGQEGMCTAIADTAAEHAVKEVYQFVKDWEALTCAAFEERYGGVEGWGSALPDKPLRNWLKSQGVCIA